MLRKKPNSSLGQKLAKSRTRLDPHRVGTQRSARRDKTFQGSVAKTWVPPLLIETNGRNLLRLELTTRKYVERQNQREDASYPTNSLRWVRMIPNRRISNSCYVTTRDIKTRRTMTDRSSYNRNKRKYDEIVWKIKKQVCNFSDAASYIFLDYSYQI